MKHIDTITLQGSIEQMRIRIASEQGAMHQVQLNVARWRNDASSSMPQHERGPAMASSQAEWHAAAQCHFLCWLADGGFARASAEEDVADPVEPASATHEQATASAASQALPGACQHCHNCTA